MNIFLCARNFVHFARFVYVAAFNDFKVHIPSNLSVHQNFHQLTYCKHTAESTGKDPMQSFTLKYCKMCCKMKKSDEWHLVLTTGKKEFGNKVNIPLFPTAHRLSRTWNLKLLV